MNVYLPGARLPSTYQEVEWIGRNGNNYIETGWIPTTNFTVKVGYKIADSGYRYVILSQYGGGAYNHAVALEVNSGNVSNNTVRFYCGNTPTTTQFYSSNSLNLNSFNDITITAPGTINVNGTTTTNSSMYTGTYDNKTCRLFIDNDTSFSTFSHNSFISYCKIYEGSTLVRDFIPCYRKSDSVIGLYDLANNQFYTNSGTGTFSKGNDVTMAVLKNAYIGEVWTPGSNTIAYFPFTNNALDQLGNYTLSNSGTKQSIGYLFNEVTNVNIGGGAYSDQKFASYWVKFANSSTASVLMGVGGIRLNNRIISAPSYSEFVFKDSGGSFHNLGNNGINNNTWYHIAYGWDGTSYKTYINGELKNSGSATPASYSESWIASGSGVILSDLIYEKSIRTAQEISDYYNNTKYNYGL